MDYAAEYEGLFPRRDLSHLRENSHLMSFYASTHGPFAYQLYFMPAFHNFDMHEKFSDFFAAWNKAVELKSYAPFKKYSPTPGDLEEFFCLDDQVWEEQILPLNEIFLQISEILVENFTTYGNWFGRRLDRS